MFIESSLSPGKGRLTLTGNLGKVMKESASLALEFIKANQQITVDKLKDLNKFKSGDKVQISDGVFKNWIGIFKCYSPDERIILLLKLLGNEQSLSFEKELVIAI